MTRIDGEFWNKSEFDQIPLIFCERCQNWQDFPCNCDKPTKQERFQLALDNSPFVLVLYHPRTVFYLGNFSKLQECYDTTNEGGWRGVILKPQAAIDLGMIPENPEYYRV